MNRFKAAMFDFDGTVTEKGQYSPPQNLANALVKLAAKVPIAFCTGRQLESFKHRGLEQLLGEINDLHERKVFLNNLFLIAENGAVGYFFDQNLDDFQEFYHAKWPENFISREKFKLNVGKKVAEFGHFYDAGHRVVLVIRTNFHDEIERDPNEVYRFSALIYEKVMAYLANEKPDFEQFLHVGNSGIGVIIGPADADKDYGVRKFGEFLVKNRGMVLDDGLKEIMVVGDSPQIGGNDFYFLNGKYGFPFTVGELNSGNPLLNAVLDGNGHRMIHAGGTLELIKREFCL